MARTISINLGVDFGTRFTKVCVRSDEVGVSIVDFANEGLDGALVPSVVCVDGDGTLSIPEPGMIEAPEHCITYLKMALANRGQLGLNVDPELLGEHSIQIAKPLSAFYLAIVMVRVKKWVKLAWSDHIGDRKVVWSANVGLPVKHVDSEVVNRFQEVIAVAWEWSETDVPTGSLSVIAGAFVQASARRNPNISHCQTNPEIAAAVLSFAASRSAMPGIYVYFDIGGGTVDGVIFNLLRSAGDVRINFYSGHVEALGVDWIAEDVCKRLHAYEDQKNDPKSVKRLLLTEDSEQFDDALGTYAIETSKLVGRVVYEGKQKDRRNWRAEQVQTSAAHRTLRRHWDDENLIPLSVFVGGGGSRAPFYQKSILRAYESNTLKNYGVPPFELIEVPTPSDLEMRCVDPHEYHRFLIAYGLSIPFGEGPDIGLPSQFEKLGPIRATGSIGLPDYADHKDIYD